MKDFFLQVWAKHVGMHNTWQNTVVNLNSNEETRPNAQSRALYWTVEHI